MSCRRPGSVDQQAALFHRVHGHVGPVQQDVGAAAAPLGHADTRPQQDVGRPDPDRDLSGFKPNAEAIAAENLDKIVEQLGALQIPVLLTPAAKTLDDTYAEIGQLGMLTGHQAEASALTERMKTQITKITKSVPQRATPLSYYYELDPTLY